MLEICDTYIFSHLARILVRFILSAGTITVATTKQEADPVNFQLTLLFVVQAAGSDGNASI